MHLHALEREVRILRGRLVRRHRILERNPEFVVAFAGRYFRVRVGVDIRVYADGDGRLGSNFARHMVDARQLRLAFHMESKNSVLQRQRDFSLRFSHSGKHARLHVGTRRQDPPDLPARYQIEPSTEVGKVP